MNSYPAVRWLSSSSSAAAERLRVGIVGGGAAGLSCALHLAPLVEAGLIASPIDVYDAPPPVPPPAADAEDNDLASKAARTTTTSAGGRDIGVGIWSTALDPFCQSDRESHALVYREMTTRGTWVGTVGYRIPSGKWLMKSHLPTNHPPHKNDNNMPSLLFLREKDMLQSLQKAVYWEEQFGMIRVHRDGIKTRVTGLHQESSHPWSTQLVLNGDAASSSSNSTNQDGSSFFLSDRDYHLIIAADGTHSNIRRDYGGHDSITRTRRLTGTNALLSSPIELPNEESSSDSSSSNSTTTTTTTSSGGVGSATTSTTAARQSSWGEAQRIHSVGLQDRKYTVFRGNAKLSNEEMGLNGTSFQTWGLGQSMRYATVPMVLPKAGANTNQEEEQRQVWFITIDNDTIASEPDPVKRRDMLLETFQDWHDPICRTVQATPPEEILMERAIAHRHSMGPVLKFNKVVQQIRGVRPPNSGHGPCIVFIGDACMTIDPILAQGFTVAMEGAAVLRRSVEQACLPPGGGGRSDVTTTSSSASLLAFDPYELRRQLKRRHEARMDRLVCLLRATELVQALGQPTGGLGGMFNTKILRPIVRAIPNFIKAPIFDSVLKYSLGLSPFGGGGGGNDTAAATANPTKDDGEAATATAAAATSSNRTGSNSSTK